MRRSVKPKPHRRSGKARLPALERRVEERTRALRLALDRIAFDEARLRAVFRTAFDAIIAVDGSLRIVEANDAAAAMFGIPVEGLTGLPLGDLMPERFRESHRQHAAAFAAGSVDWRAMAASREVVGVRSDGREFPIEVTISRTVDGQTLSTAIVRDLTERRRAERELREGKAKLEAAHADLRRLVAQQDRVQEAERERIARDLHDDLQQTLTAIALDLVVARSRLAAGRTDLIAPLESAYRLTGDASLSLRRVVGDLRPPVLDRIGLVPALRELVERASRHASTSFRFVAGEWADPSAGCDPGAALCLYRVAQEALNNVAKHARASQVVVELAAAGDRTVCLSIRDDGVGLRAEDRRKPRSFGLLGMAERVRAAGGDLDIRSDARGTTVEVHMPARRSDRPTLPALDESEAA